VFNLMMFNSGATPQPLRGGTEPLSSLLTTVTQLKPSRIHYDRDYP
jgi:hypothetical protein